MAYLAFDSFHLKKYVAIKVKGLSPFFVSIRACFHCFYNTHRIHLFRCLPYLTDDLRLSSDYKGLIHLSSIIGTVNWSFFLGPTTCER